MRDALRGLLSGEKSTTVVEHPPYGDAGGSWLEQEIQRVLGMDEADLWRTQPYLRTVVTFLARNVAHLGLHAHRRIGETDRRRLRDHPLPQLISRPNPHMTQYELIYRLVADKALYDRAYWIVGEDLDAPSGWSIQPVPPPWVVGRYGGDVYGPAGYVIRRPGMRATDPGLRVPADRMLVFHGWHPSSMVAGSSPVEALRQILLEQLQAQSYRQQVWERGGRVAAVITRPAGAPRWSDGARDRFRSDWKSKWTGKDGAEAGGTPILEDGMTLQRVGFSAHDEQYVEASKLALTQVAAVFHINPVMVGLLDNANYSNVREFRRMLYGDTLGPVLAEVEKRLNTFLVPRLPDSDGVYVEFNVAEKLQGSFEEQAQAMQTAVGAPWMTRAEARALMNLPTVDGADDLVVPLNVLIGGQSSPTDSGSQNLRAGMARVKEPAPETHVEQTRRVFASFFARQGEVVKRRLGAKSPRWWDGDRWDRELSDDLFRLSTLVSTRVAADTLDRLGFDTDLYDTDRTLNFLRAVADRIAGQVNAATYAQIGAALEADDPTDAVAQVFEVAETSRAEASAKTAVTTFAGFASTEAAKQVTGGVATKTWRVNSGNPRSSHAALDGETVPVDARFSNGAMFPGDSWLDVDEVAGCRCSVDINVPA